MSMRINNKNGSSRIPQKPKSNKKRLFFIFFSAFMIFFFVCTFVASMLTPSIDVPALKQNQDASLSSEDFKGRIDPRLKSVEMQENTSPVASSGTSGNENTPKNDTNKNIQNTGTNSIQQNTKEDNLDNVPYNNNDSVEDPEKDLNQSIDQSMQEPNPFRSPQDKARQPKAISQKPVQTTKSQSKVLSKSQGNLMLRDKVKVEHEPVSMNKVVIEGYSSPAEAKRVSQDLMNSNLNVTPFIKENNGTYSLQVGSFSNQQKAENLAGELKKRNMSAKIIQE